MMIDCRNLLTFGSPHQGQFGVPFCNKTTYLCQKIPQLVLDGAELDWLGWWDWLTFLQYWHDPLDRQVKHKMANKQNFNF